jgi:NAD(P)-dependent dehydrogenase (short-subunit alcohol dehydrogenase family)
MKLFGLVEVNGNHVIAVIALLIICAIPTIIRLVLKVTCGRFLSYAKMIGKTVIITGANSGIGKETARDLAKRGARVIMACRNLETAKEARDDIILTTGNSNVIVKKLDLSSQASVREFANDIIKTEQKIDVLIHNAGYAETLKKAKSVDGIELTIATNHFGPFLLTHLLIDLLKKSTPCRIIIVGSELYRFAWTSLRSIDNDKLNPINHPFPGYLYYVSKGYNILFATELAKRLEGTGITVNCLHPGMIDSGIWRNVRFPLTIPMNFIKSFFKTTVDGAQTTIYLAVSDEVDGVNGKYFMDCKESSLKDYITNPELSKQLWDSSVKMVNLTSNDPKI